MKCACTDTDCPHNPVNHDKGCSPCIAKNLRHGEIPSCFFVEVQGHDGYDGYSYRHFARLVDDELGPLEASEGGGKAHLGTRVPPLDR